MKKVCGYKSLDGQFYKKEKDCELADLKYKIKDVSRKLYNFSNDLSTRVMLSNDREVQMMEYRIEAKYKQMVLETVLDHSDNFLEIIKEKDELKDTLDELVKRKENWWWLKYKWW